MARGQRNKQKHTKDINSFLKDGVKRGRMGGNAPVLLHWVNPTDYAQKHLLRCLLIYYSPLQTQQLYVKYYLLLDNCVKQMRISRPVHVCFVSQPSHTPGWQAVQHQDRENGDGTVLCCFTACPHMNATEMSRVFQIDEGLTVLA